jgi:hypothetical protein
MFFFGWVSGYIKNAHKNTSLCFQYLPVGNALSLFLFPIAIRITFLDWLLLKLL